MGRDPRAAVAVNEVSPVNGGICLTFLSQMWSPVASAAARPTSGTSWRRHKKESGEEGKPKTERCKATREECRADPLTAQDLLEKRGLDYGI